MATVLGANSVVDSGFKVTNSVRFNDGDSSKMLKASSSVGNGYKGTLSAWVKRSAGLGVDQQIIGQQDAGHARIIFNNDNRLRCYGNNAGENNAFDLASTALFRDVGAWYHIVFAWDNTQGTAANRNKVYVNGVQLTDFATETYNPQNAQIGGGFFLDNKNLHVSGKSDGFFDGYMAEVVGIEGTTYAPTDFGEFDDDSAIWIPLESVADLTFGTNGFYLDFKDSSNLGNDANGGTDFTETNVAAIDQSTDTCTNNFCTLNAIDNYYAGATLSEGNCKVLCNAGNTSFITGTFGLTKGKWYWEAKLTTVGGEESVGITDLVSTATDNYAGQTANSYSFKGNNGNIRNDDDNTSYGSAYGTSVIGVYMDLDNNKLYFAINGTIQASGTGFAITAAASTTNGFYFPMVGDVDSDSPVWEVNFGNPVSALSSAVSDANGFGAFEYSPSDGGSASFDSAAKSFLAICTKNLATDG